MSDKLVRLPEKALPFFLMCFSFGIIALLLIGATHAHANAEDIELALIARDIGILNSWIHLSITYDGRYSTNMLHSINPLVFNKVLWYKHIIVFILLLLTMAVHTISITILDNFSRYKRILTTATFICGFFLLNPSLAHSLYWMGSSFVYLFSCIFFFFSLAAYMQYIKSSPTVKKTSFLPLALLLFVSVGFSELFLPVYLVGAIFMVLYFRKSKEDILSYIIPVAIVILTSVVFMVSTPGLGLRFQEPIERYLQLTVFKSSALNYLTFLANTVTTPAFWLMIAVTCYINLTSPTQSKLLVKSKRQLPLAVLGVLIALYIITLPFYLTKAYTGDMPVRIYIPVLFLLLFFLIYILIPSVTFHFHLNYFPKPVLYSLLAIILIISTYQVYNGKGPVGLLLSEYRTGKIDEFDRFMTSRYSDLQAAGNTTDSYKLVCVQKLNDYPKSLYTYPDSEIDRHQSKWHKFIEAYFKIDEVKVLGDSTLRFTRLKTY